MAVKRVIFIRSGETDWNASGQFTGWLAAPLNEHGRQQAQRLANFIRNIGLSALYTSDLRRALEVAELLGERLGFEPIVDGRLRERNIGHWQGMTREQIRAWFPDEYAALEADPKGFRVPGGESQQEVCERMLQAFHDIVAREDGETIGIVTHTTALHALLEALIPSYVVGDAKFGNTSVTTIARQNGEWKLVAANDLTHLEGLESRSAKEITP
ncbi:MAG: histidine phosphatase family protein [Chloroflexi bacterium]|nr:MAG: hypothetical protein CUN54_02635 [Phototrophicales bacterium]RMF77545.1 MAG: histidine phosphatase family protein [Chloroflexota bacterium]